MQLTTYTIHTSFATHATSARAWSYLSHCKTSHNCAIAIDIVANSYRRINSCSRILILIGNFKHQMSKIIKRIGKIRLAASVCDLERTLLGGQSFR